MTLRKHSGIAAQLTRLFQTRFDPRLGALGELRGGQEDAIAAEIEAALTKVQSLDEDRIIRHFVNVIRSAIRTNFYQIDADGPAEVADRDQVRQPQDRRSSACRGRFTKSSSIRRASKACICASARSRAAASAGRTGRRISAPRFSGSSKRSRSRTPSSCRSAPRAASFRNCCRSAARARRSRPKASRPIRCSFRPCSISPTTSPPTARSCRPTMWCGMTATILISSSPPTRAPRHSPTPPMRISLERGFWLGDAFASGGSAGYDHKKMGITARGAWEAVQAAFPRDGCRHHDDAVQRGRRRRHVGRRVRQRHAAGAHDPAGRGLRSSRHFHRSESGSRQKASPSASGCSTCRARAGRTTTRA